MVSLFGAIVALSLGFILTIVLVQPALYILRTPKGERWEATKLCLEVIGGYFGGGYNAQAFERYNRKGESK